MKNYKNSIFYIVIIGFFSFLMYWIFKQGKILEDVTVQEKISGNSNWQDFINSLTHNLQHPLAILLAQIVTIILVAKLFGWICRKIGQPSVIGEIVAGILLRLHCRGGMSRGFPRGFGHLFSGTIFQNFQRYYFQLLLCLICSF